MTKSNKVYTLLTRSEDDRISYVGSFDDKDKLLNVIDDDFSMYGSEHFGNYEVLQDAQTDYIILESALNDVVNHTFLYSEIEEIGIELGAEI